MTSTPRKPARAVRTMAIFVAVGVAACSWNLIRTDARRGSIVVNVTTTRPVTPCVAVAPQGSNQLLSFEELTLHALKESPNNWVAEVPARTLAVSISDCTRKRVVFWQAQAVSFRPGEPVLAVIDDDLIAQSDADQLYEAYVEGKYDEKDPRRDAVKLLSDALARKETAAAHDQLAFLLQSLGELPEAVKHRARAVQLAQPAGVRPATTGSFVETDRLSLINRYARLLDASGDRAGARAAYQQAATAQPLVGHFDPLQQAQRGIALDHVGNADDATRAFEEVLASRDISAIARMTVHLLGHGGHETLVKRISEEALPRTAPDGSYWSLLLGRKGDEPNDPDAGAQTLRPKAEIPLKNWQAFVLYVAKGWMSPSELLDRAVGHPGRLTEAHFYLGWMARKRHANADADAELSAALAQGVVDYLEYQMAFELLRCGSRKSAL